MTRSFTATIAIALLAALVLFDQATAELNPYKAPPAFALGSGQIPSGGFCGALPQ
ncbi:hypothetical protein [Paracoccus alkanivorans]|uniref:hypothetical protein n=1 Tax=Paracoccus alkanivorans TaxID=2116655 RepID=UPI00140E1C36|nr:hypothetical protein [Paracoccus alkanivorans]